jgi:hypothetical protein
MLLEVLKQPIDEAGVADYDFALAGVDGDLAASGVANVSDDRSDGGKVRSGLCGRCSGCGERGRVCRRVLPEKGRRSGQGAECGRTCRGAEEQGSSRKSHLSLLA